jgi:hypothetical protein
MQQDRTDEAAAEAGKDTHPALVRRSSGTVVLTPSQSSCPTSSLNRENSGIAPKRLTIRNLLNEQY